MEKKEFIKLLNIYDIIINDTYKLSKIEIRILLIIYTIFTDPKKVIKNKKTNEYYIITTKEDLNEKLKVNEKSIRNALLNLENLKLIKRYGTKKIIIYLPY